MLPNSEDTLVGALMAYRSSEHPSIRKCASSFNNQVTILSKGLSTPALCGRWDHRYYLANRVT